MTLLEAIEARHSVRSYISKPLTEDTVRILKEKIDECNRLGRLHMQLVTNETKAFKGVLAYGKFKGVENYIAVVGKKSERLDINAGYYGEKMALLAQTLGLSTCWVGLSYTKTDAYEVGKDEKLVCMISIGYGENQGVQHKIKAHDIAPDAPEWYKKGYEAALLCPTAINQQKFSFDYIAPVGNAKAKVKANKGFSVVGYTWIDLGIAKLHFEIGAGKDNFDWA